mmetsp:Transcript_5837/g.11008  ORF Transcript_5837/g.11008 Transcript_5837/m.11008 type:complete len:202 (+) Transcript_5837:1666-2271(+)
MKATWRTVDASIKSTAASAVRSRRIWTSHDTRRSSSWRSTRAARRPARPTWGRTTMTMAAAAGRAGPFGAGARSTACRSATTSKAPQAAAWNAPPSRTRAHAIRTSASCLLRAQLTVSCNASTASKVAWAGASTAVMANATMGLLGPSSVCVSLEQTASTVVFAWNRANPPSISRSRLRRIMATLPLAPILFGWVGGPQVL